MQKNTHASSESEPLYAQERAAHGTREFTLATTATKSREKRQNLARAQCRFLPHTTCPASENASVVEAYCKKTIWHQRHPHTATNDSFVTATSHYTQTRVSTATSDKGLKCRNCHAETNKKSLTDGSKRLSSFSCHKPLAQKPSGRTSTCSSPSRST